MVLNELLLLLRVSPAVAHGGGGGRVAVLLFHDSTLLLLSQALRRDFGGLCDTQTNMMQQWPPRGLGLAFVVVVVEVYCLKCNRMATVFIRRGVVSRVDEQGTLVL